MKSPTVSSAMPSADPAVPVRRSRQAGGVLDSPTILGGLGFAIFFGLLEAVYYSGILPAREFPAAHTVVWSLFELVADQGLWTAAGETLRQAGAALLLGSLVAIPLGLAIGSSELAWKSLRPTIEFLRPIPSVALLPMVVLVWGSGPASAILIAALGVNWIMLIHAIYGVREVDPKLRLAARAYNLDRLRTLVFVILPSAVPLIATGVRVASSVSLILVVATQLVLGTPGLGQMMITAQNSIATAQVYALVMVTGLLGVIIHVAFSVLERRAAPWRVHGESG